MSEYMGMIWGSYDAKEEGFHPGGASLHSCMTPHGPDTATFKKASADTLKPVYLGAGLAFMFESTYLLKVSETALMSRLQIDYWKCWSDLPKLFTGQKEP
jgi:homogentisate 1,2-dioxygenase